MTKHHVNDGEHPVPPSNKPKPKSRTSILDELIGQQVRQLRIERKWSQEYLGKLIGVTYQQIQKNEKGENRITASTLLMISVKTGKSMDYLVQTARKHIEENQ